MDVRSFDTLTRRASLLTLGGAALAATVPSWVAAKKKKNKKKAGKVCKKKEKKRCSSDTAACKASIQSICQLTPAQCLAAQACCDSCQATGLLACINAVSAP